MNLNLNLLDNMDEKSLGLKKGQFKHLQFHDNWANLPDEASVMIENSRTAAKLTLRWQCFVNCSQWLVYDLKPNILVLTEGLYASNYVLIGLSNSFWKPASDVWIVTAVSNYFSRPGLNSFFFKLRFFLFFLGP